MEIENNLKKTMKIKRNENIFVSVRREDKNKSTKNYLSPTISSINKTTQKFNNRPSSSCTNKTNFSKTTSDIFRRKTVNNPNEQKLLSKSSNSIIYHDNLHHFDCTDNIIYDPYGHFS